MNTPNTKEVFSTRLLELRKKKRISRQKAADDLNISRSTLEYYEKCKRVPDIETLNKIAHYYMVSTDYLLGNTDKLDPDIDFTRNFGAVYLYTGLYEDAFETLLDIHENCFFDERYINGSFSKVTSSQYKIVEALNCILRSDNGLDLLALIHEYLEANKNKTMPFLIEIIEKLRLLNDELEGED
ncbi:MAG: helix-turn-helix domain-containing protein [Oscillospiraceae bacterium]